MTIKEITAYETEDQRIWRTLRQAELWDKMLKTVKAKRLLDNYEIPYNMRNEGYENHYHPVGRDSMQIRQVSKWETYDGKFFDSEQDALEHIKILDRRDKLINFLVDFSFDDKNMDLESMAELLLTHWNMEKK